jgi:TonB family protein
MTLLVGLAIRSSVVLAAGLLLNACLGKRSAALRHRVLVLTVLAAALVVPLSMALPEWPVVLPARLVDPGPASVPVLPAGESSSTVTAPDHALPRGTSGSPSQPAPSRAVSPLVMAWLAGFVVFASMLLAGLARVGRLASNASPVEDERWLDILDTLGRHYGLARRIVIARTNSVDLLATWGVLRPQILVPARALDWSSDRVRVVLGHELAHIHRHDWMIQMGAEALRAVLWFNPLAWMACTRLRRESEQACDDEVLAMGVGGRDYAAHLIDLVRQCRRTGSPWAPVLPMAHPSTLERRIAAMLNPRLDRHAPSRPALTALGVLLLLVTLPAAAARPGQAGPAPLTGTIYDVSGAVLPGVDVSLTDANKVTVTTTTAATGRFEFPSVGPGPYSLRARLTGFRTMSQQIELGHAGHWDRAITLQVGGLSESVSVRATRLATPPRQVPGVAPAAPIRVGGSIRVPRKEVDVRPVFPVSMREAGRTGIVLIDAIIGTDGSVSSVRVLSADAHPDFAVAAVDAVRQWRFTPTLLNNEPIEVAMTVTVRFDLSR